VTPAIGWVAAALICITGYCLFDPFSGLSGPFVLFLLALFVISFLANSFIGGILDLQSDYQAGAVTLAIALGCRWDGHRVITSRTVRKLSLSLFWLVVLLISAQTIANHVPLWTYPLIAVLSFYAGVHINAYLKLEDPRLLRSFDAIASPSLLFYAATLGWADRLPAAWWVVVVFFIVYPLLIRREDRFGLPALKGLFVQRNG
jgi:hypothetical protein